MRDASAILDAREHDGLSVHDRRRRVEDGVDRLAPVGGGQDRVAGVAPEHLVARHHAALARTLRRSRAGQGRGVEQQLGAMEGERGLGALVCVEVGLAEAVAAASRREVVERAVEPIAAQEPVERVARARSVLRVARRDECSELGLDERGRVERLLVPLAGRGLVAVSSMMPRQPQHAVVEAALVAQPCERLEPDRDVGRSSERRSSDDERLGEPRVVVCETVLEPQPRS